MTIVVGDCREVLAGCEPDTFHAVVTDPPYELTGVSRGGSPRTNDPTKPHGRHNLQPAGKGFMGHAWDGSGVSFDAETWRAVYRVLKPGGHILDPFMGSGSTGVAAALEGFAFTGIDLSEEYAEIARRRIAHAGSQPALFREEVTA